MIGVGAAWRGSQPGLLTAILARVVDTALGIPAFFLDAPPWVLTLIISMMALTLVGIWFVAPSLRRVKAGVA